MYLYDKYILRGPNKYDQSQVISYYNFFCDIVPGSDYGFNESEILI